MFLQVSVIRTESANQAKDIMEIMSDADAVLVAGGDGTMSDAVTGLLLRQDSETAARVPMGVLPVGRTNSLAHRLFRCDDDVRLMGEATMSVVRQLKRPCDVMEVENMCEEGAHSGKKIYCLNRVEVGAWKDARLRTDKYWLFGFGLKNYMTYIGTYLTGQKHIKWGCDMNVRYTEDDEASADSEVSPVNSATPPRQGLVSWMLGGRTQGSEPVKPSDQSVKWSNDKYYDGPQITVENGQDSLVAIVQRGTFDFLSFVSYGWSTWRHRFSSYLENPSLVSVPHEILTTQQMYLTPHNLDAKLCMDGDEVDFSAPVKLRHLKDKITIFCAEADAVQDNKNEHSSSHSSLSRWSNVKSSFIKSKSF